MITGPRANTSTGRLRHPDFSFIPLPPLVALAAASLFSISSLP